MAAPAPTPPAVSGTTNVNNLGHFLDGWADLIEERGDKAQEARQLVYQFLKERNMPDIAVAQKEGVVGLRSAKRPYNLTTTHPGATTAIYVGQHGQDLYVSWRTYRQAVLHDRLKVAVVIAVLIGLFFLYQGYSNLTGGFFSFMSAGTAILTSLPIALGVAIGVLIAEVVLMGIWGHYINRDAWSLFFVQPNLFDADDITAMSLSAHKSILRALDKTGIDTSELRLKQHFKGGRSNETV